jgi:hypothetical protein
LAFELYQNTSVSSCHQAEGFGEWFYNEAFRLWKCAELRARLYVYFIDNPSCWDDIKHQHPIFAEWAYYCKGWMFDAATITPLVLVFSLMIGLLT